MKNIIISKNTLIQLSIVSQKDPGNHGVQNFQKRNYFFINKIISVPHIYCHKKFTFVTQYIYQEKFPEGKPAFFISQHRQDPMPEEIL